jgi:DNA-binding GntR family transcriptional regulator
VFNHLHAEIVNGSLPPGTRLDLDAVAEELDVSRTPVREAMLRLESEGLVERSPYRGAIVAAIDPVLAAQTTAVRIHLEGLAVRLAVPGLTEANLAEMADCLKELDELERDPGFTTEAWNELNAHFHEVIYEAADCPPLTKPITALAAHGARIRMHFDPRKFSAGDDHRAILAACKSGDAEAAARACQQHILNAYRSSMRITTVEPDSPLGLALKLASLELPST